MTSAPVHRLGGTSIAVAACLVAVGYLLLTVSSGRTWQSRVERIFEFGNVGKRIAEGVRANKPIPQSLDELRTQDWITSKQWEFLRSNSVVYIPPESSTAGQVILRMPYESGCNLIIQLDGSLGQEIIEPVAK
jgi:hypothetical protein